MDTHRFKFASAETARRSSLVSEVSPSRTGVRMLEVGDETLVLDEASGQIHQLNATASFVWRQCDGRKSPEEIAGLLTREFDVDLDIAVKDVVRVIEKLEELTLLRC